LIEVVNSQARNYAPAAIESLGRAGLVARTAIPSILAALDGTNSSCWLKVPSALTSMGVPPASFLKKLEEKLEPEHASEFAFPASPEELARIVLTLDPASVAAQRALVFSPQIPDASPDDLEALGNADPAIPEVKAALRKALNSGSFQVHKAASESLKKIEAREKARARNVPQ
jgi:hypothetical protein